MAVGTSLSNLRRMLRAEVSQSLTPTQGVNAQGQYDLRLERQQKELWTAYEWPHLRFYRDVALAEGQRFYSYPAGVPFEAINRIWCRDGTRFLKLGFGIRMPDYECYGGETGRSWPVQKWQNVPSYDPDTGITTPTGQIEIWPVPSKDGEVMRIEGQAPVNALVADADVAVLDDVLLVLYAAAEILAEQKAEHASLKLQKAQQYLRRLLANQGADKRDIPILGGAGSYPSTRGSAARPGIDYIPSGYGG